MAFRAVATGLRVDVPDPEDFGSFSKESLSSFIFDNCFRIDVIYIKSLRMVVPHGRAGYGSQYGDRQGKAAGKRQDVHH